MPKAEQFDALIEQALFEDIGGGDVTTEATVPESAVFEGRFMAKAGGIIAGLELARRIFHLTDRSLTSTFSFEDGDRLSKGDLIGTVRGNGRSILTAERVVLNFMQRMSGIATLTRQFVDAVAGSTAVILDTRKTAPGLRLIDKWAVSLGGGQNHRLGLFDMALIKENHIAASGGLEKAVQAVRSRHGNSIKIEIEVRNIEELRQALDLPVDMIMLDNFLPQDMRTAVSIAAGRIPLEASGNVTPDTVGDIAETGVDYISVGMLTHSVQALDISLLIDA